MIKLLKNTLALILIIPATIFMAIPLCMIMAALDGPSRWKRDGGYWNTLKSMMDVNILKEP